MECDRDKTDDYWTGDRDKTDGYLAGDRDKWELTTDPETMPSNSTSFVKTNLQGKLKQIVGNLYGLRTWVEYGFRQCKQELGWTDYRFTNFKDIEKMDLNPFILLDNLVDLLLAYFGE